MRMDRQDKNTAYCGWMESEKVDATLEGMRSVHINFRLHTLNDSS